jgi:hypothetical protein
LTVAKGKDDMGVKARSCGQWTTKVIASKSLFVVLAIPRVGGLTFVV